MQGPRSSRRSRGTGSLIVKHGSYYGQWRAGGKLIMRKLGAVRSRGGRDGLTRVQAERLLQERIARERGGAQGARLSLDDAGDRHVDRLERLGRKRSTIEDYRSTLRVHLVPHFGKRNIDTITVDDIEHFITAKSREGKSAKSIRNYLGLLHGVFEHAIRLGSAQANPVKLVDKPALDRDQRIRYLDDEELEALLRATARTPLGQVDRLVCLVAAMTGLRQGELLALRWRDVDFDAGRIRVRENYVRGEFGSPKSKRSTRSVPLAARVTRDLREHYMRTYFKAPDDLVFAHPDSGRPLERSRLLKRYKGALRRGGLREARFHDLRHTFGTRAAAAGVPLRTLQEWMGHRDFKTTLIYADYAPSDREVELIERAFASIKRPSNRAQVNASEAM